MFASHELQESGDAGRRVSGRAEAMAVIWLQKTAKRGELRGEPGLICA
jgi:hypothetical protein